MKASDYFGKILHEELKKALRPSFARHLRAKEAWDRHMKEHPPTIKPHQVPEKGVHLPQSVGFIRGDKPGTWKPTAGMSQMGRDARKATNSHRRHEDYFRDKHARLSREASKENLADLKSMKAPMLKAEDYFRSLKKNEPSYKVQHGWTDRGKHAKPLKEEWMNLAGLREHENSGGYSNHSVKGKVLNIDMEDLRSPWGRPYAFKIHTPHEAHAHALSRHLMSQDPGPFVPPPKAPRKRTAKPAMAPPVLPPKPNIG